LTTPEQPAVLAELPARLTAIARLHPTDVPDDQDERLSKAMADTASALLAAAEVPGHDRATDAEELLAEEDTGAAGPAGLVCAADRVAGACHRIAAGRAARLHDELTDLALAHRHPRLAWRLRRAEYDELHAAWPAARRQIHSWLQRAAPGWTPAGSPDTPPSRPGCGTAGPTVAGRSRPHR
jgi:hypothetical protein